MEEYRNGIPVVRKKVVFLTKQGLDIVRDLVVPCDKGHHLTPLYPLTVFIDGSKFVFLRDAKEPQKRPMYREVDNDQLETEAPLAIEDYQEMIGYHNELIKTLGQMVLDFQPQFGSTQNVIKTAMEIIEDPK